MPRLTGELVAVEWDDGDEPTEVALETDGDRYVIAHGDQYEELLPYIGHEVEVVGDIDEDEQGTPVIVVRSFEVLELMTEEDYDDYGADEWWPGVRKAADELLKGDGEYQFTSLCNPEYSVWLGVAYKENKACQIIPSGS